MLPIIVGARGAAAQPPYDDHTANGEGAPDERPDGDPRELGGHLFIPSQLVSDPFATTYLRATTVGNWAVSRGPSFDGLGSERDYPHGGVAQILGAQVAPFPWLALRVSAAGLASSGMDAVTLMAVEPSLDVAYGGGMTLALPAVGSFRAALVFDGERGPPRDVTVVDATLDRLVAGQALVLDGLQFDEGMVTTLGPGVSFAYGLHRALGLLVDIRYVVETAATVDLGSQRDGYALGVAFDLDLHAITPVPLGLAASFRMLERWLDGLGPNRELDVGLFYVPGRSLSLGVSGGLRDYPQTVAVRTTARTAQFSMRYYF